MANDNFVTFEIGKTKHIALVAHDGKKKELVEWCDRNKEILYKPHSLENEIFLQGLLADIHTDLGMGAFRYLELERGGYGWAEKVVWQECTVGKGRWHMPINSALRRL